MTYEKIDRLISITREKNKLLQDMLSLTKKQKEAIKKDAHDNLATCLEEKDRIIKQIDQLDRSFLEFFSEIKREHQIDSIDQLDTNLYPNLKELKEVVKEVTSTLLAISLLDEENSKSIKEKLESTKAELTRIKNGQKAYKGYKYKFSESFLLDEKK